MTLQQAADYLNVQRDYVLMLIEQGVLPCFIDEEALKAYKAEDDAERKLIADELTQMGQELR
jgi:hypothetical protein